MQTIHTVLLVGQVLVAMVLIGLILIQHGKGADAGAAFGSGASATVFGARGSGNFFSRATAVLALVFVANSLFLAWVATERVRNQTSVMDTATPAVQSETLPANETTPPAATESAAAGQAAPAADTAPAADSTPAADSAPASETAPAQQQSDVPALPVQN